MSGQAINLQKSGIMFSTNVGNRVREEISGILQVDKSLHDKSLHDSNYLGLPSLVGKSKRAVFNFLKDRIWKMIEGWDSKLLSRAAKQGAGPRFIWVGLWKAKEALKDGFRWVVEDGFTIDVYKDRLLCNKEDFGVCRSYDHESNDVAVKSLFIPDSRRWDTDYIRGIFNEEDAEAILSTSVYGHQAPDRIVWHDAKDGGYTVRDGYRFWNKNNRSNAVNIVRSNGWNKIWNLQSCWDVVGLKFNISADQTISEWLLDVLCSQEMEVLLKIVYVLWGIWFFRNKLVWDNKVVTAEVAIEWSSKMILDWRQAKSKPRKAPMNGVQQDKWKPPLNGAFKLNVDASVFPEKDFFSIGMVIRDYTGGFIQGRVKKFADKVSMFEAEATGVSEALSWVHALDLKNVDVETDSLLTVLAIKSKKVNRSEVGDVIESCKKLLQIRPDISLTHIRKHTNKTTHMLARSSCDVGCLQVFHSPPSYLLETLLSDSLIE